MVWDDRFSGQLFDLLIGSRSGAGVSFGWKQYEEVAEAMRNAKRKVMISINDHPDIRRALDGLTMHALGIKYSVANVHGDLNRKSVPNWPRRYMYFWEIRYTNGLC